MKVTAVTPPEAASDALHPDHDRWVKETTLKMEVEHAKRLGLTLAQAEAENARQLARAERIAADRPAPAEKKKKPAITPQNAGHSARTKSRGVTVKAAKPIVPGMKLSPCGRCGTCRRCKREKRVFALTQKAREGDMRYVVVLWKLGMYAQQAQDGTGPFAGVPPRDANRMVIARLEEVCDASVKQMGPWR